MDYVRDYRPGKATVKGVPQDRPSYDVWALTGDEFDESFGTRTLAERIDWASYLAERGDLLRPHSGTLMGRVGAFGGRRRFWAYLLLRDPDDLPKMREPRERSRVYTW